MDRRPNRPRIADVARAAGVSKTAVSFAFNNPDRLSAETAKRIREVAGNLGYRPHPVARMLTQRQTMTLGVLTPQALAVIFSNPFFALFSEGVASAAEARGFGLHFISPLQGSLASAMSWATVDGVVAIGLSAGHPEVEPILGSGLPMVLVDSVGLSSHSSVSVDDEGGARAAAEHLLELGHRDVLVIAIEQAERPTDRDTDPETGRGAGGVTSRRLLGVRSAFGAAGLELPEDAIVPGRATIEGGAAAFRSAWNLGRRPTAVLAMSDATAIGVIIGARDLGLDVPVDLSVVGFDDIDLAAHVDPPLTTVHQPIRQKGVEAVRLLLAEVDAGAAGAAYRPEHVRLETRLVVRATTARARH